VRITGQLIEAETGHHVWAERYDRGLNDIFAVQDEITEAITAALEPAVGRAEIQRARLKSPSNLDAWDFYHRGLGSLDQFTREGFSHARNSFARSIALDPNFAPPHAWSACMSNWEAMFGWANDPHATVREGMKEAETAIASDPADALGHAALCVINAHARRYDVGLSEGRQAIELNPSFALGHFLFGVALMLASRPQEAVESMSRAMRLSVNEPLMFTWYSALSLAHYTARDYEQAVKVGRLAVQKAPQNPGGQRGLAISLAQLGHIDEAQATFRRFLELAPGFSADALRYSAPFRDPADFEHLVDGLRKVGWQG
jgi:tetratricopeptide (TPR) repeat protein